MQEAANGIAKGAETHCKKACFALRNMPCGKIAANNKQADTPPNKAYQAPSLWEGGGGCQEGGGVCQVSGSIGSLYLLFVNNLCLSLKSAAVAYFFRMFVDKTFLLNFIHLNKEN